MYSWILTLAILAFAPFIGIGGYIEMKVFRGGATKDKASFEDSGKVSFSLSGYFVHQICLTIFIDEQLANKCVFN